MTYCRSRNPSLQQLNDQETMTDKNKKLTETVHDVDVGTNSLSL